MFVCVDCGSTFNESFSLCGFCFSPRLATTSQVEGVFGPDWASYFLRPADKMVVNYGGGVNSVAVLLWLYENGHKPDAIVMANPGHERKRTISYIEDVLRPFLSRIKWPDLTIISRESEAAFNPHSQWKGTLGDACYRYSSWGSAGIPSAAFGMKSCSQKFKGEPMDWWLQRQPWVQEEWADGRRILRVIGYDSGEAKRINKHRHRIAGKVFDIFGKEREALRYIPWYPLSDSGINREGCESLILRHLPSTPGKSACVWCPNNTLEEWYEMREEEPEQFAYAVEMERRAFPYIEQPETMGLMRRNPVGQRQLHLYVFKERRPIACGSEDDVDEVKDGMPCECAL